MKRHLLLGFLATMAFGILFTGCAAEEEVAEPTPEQTVAGDNVVQDDAARTDLGGTTDMNSSDLSTE